MCVLRDTYLIDDPAHFEHLEEQKKNLKLVKKPVEVIVHDRSYAGFVTTHFWCRTCKEKTPAAETRTCDCGMIMCVTCWEEWEATCPICDAAVG